MQGGGREEHPRQRDSLVRSLGGTDPGLFMNRKMKVIRVVRICVTEV